MRYLLLIMTCILLQVSLTTGRPATANDVPLIKLTHFTNGKACFSFDYSGMIKSFRETNETKSNLILNDVKLSIHPNPVQNWAKIQFNLNANSEVKIYAFDNNHFKKQFFNGYCYQGQNEYSINLLEFNKGLLMIYLEVDGNIYSTKTIKIE
jgi:hypothetical protein